MPDDAVHPHEMVHVGVAYEYRIEGREHSLGKMMYPAAIEKQGAPRGPDADQQQGVVKEPGKESRLQVAKWSGHG